MSIVEEDPDEVLCRPEVQVRVYVVVRLFQYAGTRGGGVPSGPGSLMSATDTLDVVIGWVFRQQKIDWGGRLSQEASSIDAMLRRCSLQSTSYPIQPSQGTSVHPPYPILHLQAFAYPYCPPIRALSASMQYVQP